MKTTILLALASLCILTAGCASVPSDSDNNYRTRQQMLDAQSTSITSIENEISRIRDGNGGDMSKWTPDTIKLYGKWQEELGNRYVEREKLIKSLNGNALSEMTVGGN